MHLRCPCTAAMATADPPAPTEHIGSERAHARGLPAMLQLCSPSMSRPAQIKEQLELDVEEHRRIAERHYTRTASGRVVTVGDLPRAGPSCAFASVDPIIRTLQSRPTIKRTRH